MLDGFKLSYCNTIFFFLLFFSKCVNEIKTGFSFILFSVFVWMLFWVDKIKRFKTIFCSPLRIKGSRHTGKQLRSIVRGNHHTLAFECSQESGRWWATPNARSRSTSSWFIQVLRTIHSKRSFYFLSLSLFLLFPPSLVFSFSLFLALFLSLVRSIHSLL